MLTSIHQDSFTRGYVAACREGHIVSLGAFDSSHGISALHMDSNVFSARVIWLLLMCFSVKFREFHMALFLFLHPLCCTKVGSSWILAMWLPPPYFATGIMTHYIPKFTTWSFFQCPLYLGIIRHK